MSVGGQRPRSSLRRICALPPGLWAEQYSSRPARRGGLAHGLPFEFWILHRLSLIGCPPRGALQWRVSARSRSLLDCTARLRFASGLGAF